MKRLTYKIEATENGYTESLSFLGITVSKTWKRTDTGMRCEENDLCEQLEEAGIKPEQRAECVPLENFIRLARLVHAAGISIVLPGQV